MVEKIDDKENLTRCKKIFFENKYYYDFKNMKRDYKEEQDFMSSKKFTVERYQKNKNRFETIVYVSDQERDLSRSYEFIQTKMENWIS
ncbi:hypothetical protein NO343_00135 [Mycoplasma capricolum subsp. capricolum]|nr:hypothetical protein [Mycoplasma capricolum]WBX36281.1 hypothetical protein NO343_00135 [Mycoplasma capricolum subsp. capricolum]